MDTIDKPTRKSLPLTEQDLRDLASLRQSESYRSALAHLAGARISATSSEAAVLHAVWEAGVKAVMDRVEEAGYQQLAAERDLSARQAVARRRPPTWADES